jgi:hypothetical protein
VQRGARVALAAALVAAVANGSHATSIATETFAGLVRRASDVAVIEIVRRVPVEYEYEGETRICGYRVEARVVESFHGETRRIEFADVLEGEPRESKSRYLLFAQGQSNPVDPTPPGSLDEARIRCWIAASPKLVLVRPRTLLRLVDSNTSAGGWVLVPPNSSVESEGLSQKPADGEDAGAVLVSWPEVRRTIDSTLEAIHAEGSGE